MSTNLEYNIHSICRICLEYIQYENAYDLFLIPGLAKKLIVCTCINVEPNDGYPKNICGVCYTRLNDLHDFQKQCIESVQKFQDIFSKNGFPEVPLTTVDNWVPAGTEETQNALADDDEAPNCDPLLNHKMELLENEDDVFKLIGNVDKEAKETEEKEKQLEEANLNQSKNGKIFSDESSTEFEEDNDEDEDFICNENDKSDSDDDDLPLAARLRKKEAANSSNGPKGKVKRKRIPAAERHLHRIITCHICQKKFKKADNYQNHMKYHNDKLPFQCTVENCQRGFTTSYALRVHVEHTHTVPTEKYPCTVEGCGRVFHRTRILNWHLKKIHKVVRDPNEIKKYPCSECEKVFKCPMAHKKHMFKHDGKELPFPCNICGKRFVTNTALKDHLMRHAGIKNYMCPYCGVGKTTKQEWNNHITTHTKEKKFKCELCPHASHNRQNLRMHIKIVHDKIKDYACQYCGKTFGKSNACKMHETIHTGDKKHECKVCNKKFLYLKGLTKHLQTHEKRVLRAFEGIPNKEFTPSQVSEATLKETHQKVTEELLKVTSKTANPVSTDPRRVARVDISLLAGTAINPIPSVAVPSWSPQVKPMLKEGPHICPDCGQGFNGIGNLKRHHRIVHERVKDFACRYCPLRFAKADTLKHHEMTHTGEKPHQCMDCGKRFIQSVALKRHMKVHMDRSLLPPTVKKFECTICGKRFIQNYHLKRHMKVHITQPKPATVLAAREDVQRKKIKHIEVKRKEEEDRSAIAEAAKQQLDEIKEQENKLKMAKEILKDMAPVPIPERMPPSEVK
ncbi:zinc finger protein 540-like [Teleopsis dalmanni]|uniref:zinc finger protein 540-like n=1 Tax=Teleopsis dalmanni TaxID=139649 RepID=UPI0018CEF861|nr:zinc finger protein 540-like [Teleopsis dalmanni]XP_037939544.1 zinc finger protein 540-like [Teleopsis dalmanni]